LEDAIFEVAALVERALVGCSPSLLVVFVSEHHAEGFERIPEWMGACFPGAFLVGCSAAGVIGGGREIEGQPGVSLTAASLPGVEIEGFRFDMESLSAGPQAVGSLPVAEGAGGPHFLLLSDPFSFDAELFLRALDRRFPESRKVGGLASAARTPGGNALWLESRTYRSGLVGVALSGAIRLDTIVAQGCRPIGEPMFVTRAREHLILELDGRAPLEVLRGLFERLEGRDRELFRHSLFLGVAMDESRQEYRHGDFLIRNLLGFDERTGALAVGARFREGAVVQFHLRDARTSAEDLDVLLSRYAAAGRVPAGALLFSCLGRGRHLYGRPDHDTDAFRNHLGEVALGGFFCNGEIGPIRGQTFLHGYTSSFGLFLPD
jgi:small ligand-binding sensory domain FIST